VPDGVARALIKSRTAALARLIVVSSPDPDR
jgi:hypothetical protein